MTLCSTFLFCFFCWMCNFEWWCVVFVIHLLLFFFPRKRLLPSCAIVSFECLRSLTLKPPLQMSICPSAVPLPQYECIVSKPQTFKAPLTLTRCGCVLLVASAAACSKHMEKKEKNNNHNMQPTYPKDLSLSRTHQLSHGFGFVCQALGPHSVAVVREAENC